MQVLVSHKLLIKAPFTLVQCDNTSKIMQLAPIDDMQKKACDTSGAIVDGTPKMPSKKHVLAQVLKA